MTVAVLLTKVEGLDDASKWKLMGVFILCLK